MILSTQLESIFYQALELDGEKRDTFIQQACNGNVALHEDLKKLFSLSNESEQYFENLPERILNLGSADAQLNDTDFSSKSADEIPLGQIGPWKLCKLLGRGGMGSVYLAERADFQYARQVALKVLPRRSDDPIARYRFKHEQQILAQLNHQNIARFIDGGVAEDGVRYFAMDFIQGEPIDDYCRTHNIGIKQKLDLFIQTCRAVQYAHQKNVVHRDLKPANILVSVQGEVKLLDFGIAKIIEEEKNLSELTKFASRPLTVAYSSPEMIEGKAVDKTTDIYSLGIILYELICQKKPFAKQDSLTQLCNSQWYGKIHKPSTLTHTRQLGTEQARDLDTIILKALNPRTKNRYASVEWLQDDIERMLARHPIKARAYSPTYYLNCFIRRHRQASITASLIFLVLTFTSIFSFMQMREAQQQRDLASYQQRHTQSTNEFLNVLLGEIGSEEEALTKKQLLRRGLALLNKQEESLEKPDYLGQIFLQLAHAFKSIGQIEEAKSLLQRADTVARQANDTDLLATVLCTSTEYNIRSDYEFAKKQFLEAEKIQINMDSRSLKNIAFCTKAHSILLEKAGNSEEALQVLNKGLEKLIALYPGPNNLLFSLLNFKSHVLYSLGKQEELLENNATLLSLHEQIGRSGTTNYMVTLQNQASLFDTMGEVKTSAALRKSIVDSKQPIPHLAQALYANSLVRLGEFQQAQGLYLISIEKAKDEENPLRVAYYLSSLGETMIALKKYSLAEEYFKQSENIYLQSPIANRRRLDRIALGRIKIIANQGMSSLAQKKLETLLHSNNYPAQKHGFHLSIILREASRLALEQKQSIQAERYIEDLLELCRSLARDESQSADMGYALLLKADLMMLKHQYIDAQQIYSNALARISSAAGEKHPDALYIQEKLRLIDSLNG